MHKVSLQTYIYGALKDVDNEAGISRKGMAVLNDMVNILADRIYEEAVLAARMKKRSTIGKREIELAVQRILPRELSKLAFTEVQKACAKYKNSFA